MNFSVPAIWSSRRHRSVLLAVLVFVLILGTFHSSPSAREYSTAGYHYLTSEDRYSSQRPPQIAFNPYLRSAEQLLEQDYPKKIFQTWKNHDQLPPDGQKSINTWRDKNPDHNYTFYDDAAAAAWVSEHFDHRPDLVKVFKELTQRIIAIDLLRYLLIYVHGGIYSDIDTFCLQPIDSWFSAADKKDASDITKSNIVIGMEAALVGNDVPHQQNWFRLTNRVQMLQWTVMSKPGHLILNRTIDSIVSRVTKEGSGTRNETIADLKYESGEILNLSGPGLYSTVARKYIDEKLGRVVGDDDVAETTKPRLFADVLVLPVNAWAPGQEHSNSGSLDTAFVQHLWKGNWKTSDIYR